MKPAKIATFLILITASFVAGVWVSYRGSGQPDQAKGRKILYYHDPMHPAYKSDKPGIAPDCGMQLEPVYEDEEGADNPGAVAPPSTVRITPERQQVIGVRAAAVGKTSYASTIRASGRVAPDERLIYRIRAVVDGWIRQTFSNSTGSMVKKDERLASLYSLDFQNGVTAYLYALQSIDVAKKSPSGMSNQMEILANSLRMATETLENLGMSSIQIEELRRTRQPTKDIVLYSPADAFVIARNVSEGQRVIRGDELYRLADLSRIWILADLFERESHYVRPGQRVNVLYQGRTLRAKVSDILPQFDPVSRSLEVRLEMDNPSYILRPDMFVDVEIPVQLPPAITVPADAVVDTGLRKTVFVDSGDGYFEPRQVETGWRFGDRVEVTKGLMEGEHIVVSGNFLIDSESRLKLAAAGLPEDYVIDPVCGMGVDPKKAGQKSTYKGQTHYFCNPDCKAKFDAGPEKYLGKNSEFRSQNSGEGKVTGQAERKTVRDPVCGMDVDISASGVLKAEYQGKTYYFCNPSCKESFLKNPSKYLVEDSKF